MMKSAAIRFIRSIRVPYHGSSRGTLKSSVGTGLSLFPDVARAPRARRRRRFACFRRMGTETEETSEKLKQRKPGKPRIQLILRFQGFLRFPLSLFPFLQLLRLLRFAWFVPTKPYLGRDTLSPAIDISYSVQLVAGQQDGDTENDQHGPHGMRAPNLLAEQDHARERRQHVGQAR